MSYGPPDRGVAPRFTGIRTFARAPHVASADGVDAAMLGVPFDTATSMRPGARFGPAGIRDASMLLRPWNAAQQVDVFGALSLADLGDLHDDAGQRAAHDRADRGAARAGAARGRGADRARRRSLDRARRAARARRGARSRSRSCCSTPTPTRWEQYCGERYFHGTPFKRAMEEGLIDPSRSLLAGMRGSLYAASDLDEPRSWGFEIVVVRRAAHLDAGRVRRARALARRRRAGVPRASTSTCIDPAFAPATGTPEVCGLLPHEAIAFLRALRGRGLHRLRPRSRSRRRTTPTPGRRRCWRRNVAYEFLDARPP